MKKEGEVLLGQLKKTLEVTEDEEKVNTGSKFQPSRSLSANYL